MDGGILRDGTIALITGAGSGIGEATAKRLADAGARVICAGRDRGKLDAVVAQLGGRGLALVLDVTDPAATRNLVADLPPKWREIDILINNAGHDVGGRQRFDQGDADEYAAVIETNVTGMIRVTHAVIQGMIARDRGHVVNLGSLAGLRVARHGGIYNTSKFAVRAFTEALRIDFAETELRITEILPGLTRTGFAAARLRGDQEGGRAYYDGFPQTMVPDDIARSIMFALEQPPHVDIAQLLVIPTHNAQ